jgi:hypothetical protein
MSRWRAARSRLATASSSGWATTLSQGLGCRASPAPMRRSRCCHDDAACLLVSVREVACGDFPDVPVVPALSIRDLRDRPEVDVTDVVVPEAVADAEVVVGPGPDDDHAGDVLRGGAVPAGSLDLSCAGGGRAFRLGEEPGDGGERRGQADHRPACERGD